MTFDIGGAAVAAVVNAAMWFLFKRQIDKQDRRLELQEAEIRELRDQGLAVLSKRVDECMPRATCEIMHGQIERRLDQGTNDFRSIRDDISIMRAATERNSALLEHVLRNMGLHLIEKGTPK